MTKNVVDSSNTTSAADEMPAKDSKCDWRATELGMKEETICDQACSTFLSVRSALSLVMLKPPNHAHLVQRFIPDRGAVNLHLVAPPGVLASLADLAGLGVENGIVLFRRNKVHFMNEHPHKGTLWLLF